MDALVDDVTLVTIDGDDVESFQKGDGILEFCLHLRFLAFSD